MPNRNYVMTGAPKSGVSGYLFRAPLGTALPADCTTALAAAYIDQGYVTEDGVKRAVKKSFESIKDMGGDEVLKVRSDHSVSVELELMETLNGKTATTVYGSSAVTVTEATSTHGTQVSIAYKGEEVDNSVWVLDTALGGKMKRYVWPNCQLATEDSTVTLVSKSAATLPVSLAAYQDSTGVFFYEYSDNGVKSA